MTGVTGVARWEAAVDVLVDFVEDQPPGRQLDLDPGFALEQMTQALPMITDRLTAIVQQCAREDGVDATVSARCLAGAIARVALSHYMFPDVDATAAVTDTATAITAAASAASFMVNPLPRLTR